MIITEIPAENRPLLNLIIGTGVKRVIIGATRIEFFPRLTPGAIEALTSIDSGPIYTDLMRMHWPATRHKCKLRPGDYDLSGPSPEVYDHAKALKRTNDNHAPNPAKRP